ncbi:ABC transporter ATP-binding protein [Fibrobacter sp. UBA4297]|uniref:ABC transporter ATP-binding protein n=1 Tax=Fibrobacter sp. UBA4297 TaxID=1946536 RepID=UPI0025C0B7E5|nr:ABC transporter ATP-binding protein [Fibrobacter sp. UBA4297]
MILNGNNITKEYTRRGEKFPAVNNADFFAWSGDYTVIFGESGSGKSTLLNALAGISAPTSGSIAIDGQPLYTLNDEERSRLRNERIGYIPQNAACLPAFTVTENIELAASLYKHRIDKEQIQSLLKKLGIAHLANEYPANLSGGELRRVAIARALVNNPDLIIADEPTSNLDEDNSRKVFSLFGRLAKSGAAVIVATHDRSAFGYNNRTYHMKSGTLIPDIGEYGNL